VGGNSGHLGLGKEDGDSERQGYCSRKGKMSQSQLEALPSNFGVTPILVLCLLGRRTQESSHLSLDSAQVHPGICM
jgi:hypothetical protein